METKKWEALLTAVELGSFTRAAEKLGCTQSGLTHMMNSLEGEVGFPLLVRDRYGVRLTTAGERLLPAVRELLQTERRLEGEIAAQSSSKRENIRVAAYSSICMHWLPTIVQQFRWAFPDVSVDIRMGSVEEMYRWLQEDKVDLSFASRQDRGRYDWVPLWDDPLLAILPMDYPAEGKDRFPVAEFGGKEFLMPSGFDLDILRVFGDLDVRPDHQGYPGGGCGDIVHGGARSGLQHSLGTGAPGPTKTMSGACRWTRRPAAVSASPCRP